MTASRKTTAELRERLRAHGLHFTGAFGAALFKQVLDKLEEKEQDEVIYSTMRVCRPSFHISQLTGHGTEPAFLLYDTCCMIAHETGKSYLNFQKTVGPFIHRSEKTLYTTAKLLEQAGWLEVVSRKPGDPTCYRPIKHDEWALKHPGKCIQTYSPDYWEKDPLGSAFYGFTGGIKIGGPNVLIGWRKLLSDEQILMHLEHYVKSHPKPRYNNQHTTWIKEFGNYLREEAQ
jgi:hypothetical protein